MESVSPSTTSANGKIVAALIIGLIVGFVAGVFWQTKRGGENLYKSDSTAKTENNNVSAAVVASDEATKDEGEQSATAPAVSPENKSVIVTPGAGTASVFVENQSAGNTVEVTRVASSESAWVAVRELNVGKPGNILGAKKIVPGSETASVELLRPTIAGKAYVVVLFRDQGEPAFNYQEDILIPGVQSVFVAE